MGKRAGMWRRGSRRLQIEALEPRHLLAADGHAAIVNGDFALGLESWSVTDAEFVDILDGRAVIVEHTGDVVDHVGLYQDFTIPTGAARLMFTLHAVSTEPDAAPLPAAFEAALLDIVHGTSLVPAVDSATDAFYIRDLVDGVTAGEAADGVSELPLPNSLPLQVGVDVSKIEGHEARIVFRLLGGGPGFDASVTIDDVAVVAESELASPWQNPINPLDVDANGIITPLDVLLVINHLNLHGSGPVPGPPQTPPPFLDVNGDDLVSPLDALLIINHLNRPADASGLEPEGEAVPSVAEVLVVTHRRADADISDSTRAHDQSVQVGGHDAQAMRNGHEWRRLWGSPSRPLWPVFGVFDAGTGRTPAPMMHDDSIWNHFDDRRLDVLFEKVSVKRSFAPRPGADRPC